LGGAGARTVSVTATETKAVAVAVSESNGTVRIFQNGEIVLHIEPLARPLIWRHFEMEAQDGEGLKINA